MFFHESHALEALKSNDIPESLVNLVYETLPNAPRNDKSYATFYAFILSINTFSLKKRLAASQLYLELGGNDIFIVQRIIALVRNVFTGSFGANAQDSQTGTQITAAHHNQCLEICDKLTKQRHSHDCNQLIIQKIAEITREPSLGDESNTGGAQAKKKRGATTASVSRLSDMHRKIYDACYGVLSTLCENTSNHAAETETEDSTAHAAKQYLSILMNLTPNLKNALRHVSERATQFVLDTQDKVSRGWDDCVLTWMQQLVIKSAPEKAEVKNIVLVALVTLFEAIEDSATQSSDKFVEFLETLLRNKDNQRRLFATECICRLLEQVIQGASDSDSVLRKQLIERLMIALISRFPDKVSSIRTKALTGFSNILKVGSQSEDSRDLLIEIVSNPGEDMDVSMTPAGGKRAQHDAMEIEEDQTLQARAANASLHNISTASTSLVEGDMISNTGVIGCRVYDVCSPVRKAAIQAIGQLAILCPEKFLTTSFIEILKRQALDETLTNRKQSLSTLILLFQTFPLNEEVYCNLLIVILILITDQEASVMGKALDAAKTYFIQPYSKKSTQKSVFSVLNSLPRAQLHRIKVLFSVMHKEKVLRAAQLVKLQDFIIEHDNDNAAAWVLYEDLAQYFPEEVDSYFIKQIYERIEQMPEETRTPAQNQIFYLCINILSKVCHLCAEEERITLADSIGSKIVNFEVSPSLIHGYISTLSQINATLAGSDGKVIFNQILSNEFYQAFSEVFSTTSTLVVPDEMLMRYLTTIGEVAVCFSKCSVPDKFVALVQGLIASSIAKVRAPKENSTSIYTKRQIPPAVRAHAFITLGKLCLMNEKLSRNSEKIFLRELQKAQDAEVRNNILITICDLCVRYSGVDRYVARIAERMRDDSLLVRRNAATLLAQLLAEDFIKWDPVIFFRYLSVLADSENQIVRTAEHVLMNVLPRKQPHLLFNHFVEAIFVLNNCQEHSVYNQFPQSDTEIKSFSLPAVPGDEIKTKQNQARRHIVYKFLLNQLSAEYKLKLHGRLHAEILTEFSEGKLRSESVLLDIFAILSSQDMKLDKAAASSSTGEDAQDPTSHVSSEMVSEILKRHIRDNVLPVLVHLKKSLERRKSPMLGNLLDYFHSISLQYPNEVKDLLKNDRQLRGEFEFDMRQRNRRLTPVVQPQAGVTRRSPLRVTTNTATKLSLPTLTSTSKKRRQSGFYEGPKSSTPVPRVLNAEFKSPRNGSSVTKKSSLTSNQGSASDVLHTPSASSGVENRSMMSDGIATPASVQKALFGAEGSALRRKSLPANLMSPNSGEERSSSLPRRNKKKARVSTHALLR